MKRRDFITLLGGAAAWPIGAGAQQSAAPTIGFLQPGLRDANADRVRAFNQGLREVGYIEGQNVSIEYRFAENQIERLADLAADLVRRRVAVIIALPLRAALAAKAATSTIPIVFVLADDPVKVGLVASLARPGGNLTGLADMNSEITPKRMGILHDLVPAAERVAALVNPDTWTAADIADLKAASSPFPRQIEVFTASTSSEIDAAFASLAQKRRDALLILPSAFFVDRRSQMAGLAARYRIPAIYHDRQFSEAGGLISYGTVLADQLHQLGVYTGRILRGEKAADLPVLRPVKFELVINLKTARALGLEVPPMLLSVADEVIE